MTKIQCQRDECQNTAEWDFRGEMICLEHAAEINERIIGYAAYRDDAEDLAARGLKAIQ